METSNESTTQTASTTDAQATGTETQQAASTGVSEAKAAGTGNDGAASQQTGQAAAGTDVSAQYIPNFKFKVKDKELEIDDFLKPVVKTKDVETKIREMYEKAHGLEEVKTSRETFKQQAEEWKGKYSTVESSLQTLGGYVKKGDFKSFFGTLNIPKEKIIQYAIEELKYQELPAEQKAQIDAQRQQQMEYEQSVNQSQTLQQQMQSMVQKQAEFELTQELAKPDVVSAMNAYDTRAQKAGAFKAEVIRRGQYYEAVHKISPPASQLVTEILNLIGVQQAQQGTQGTSQETSSQTVSHQQNKPTISTFAGGAKSPVKKVPQSIEDLRQLRQNLTT